MLVMLGAFAFLNIPHIKRSGFSVTSIVLDPVFSIAIEVFTIWVFSGH